MKEEKFNQIVADNSERIQRICSYYNSNPSDQQDMYQEILINIWKSLDSFRGDANLSTWIYRIAVNVSLTFTSKTYKHMRLYVNTDTQNLHSLIDEGGHEKQIQEQQLEALQQQINLLSVIDKALISLILEGLSVKEIANIVGITEANVKVKTHRIKKTLSNNLKHQTYEKQ